MKYEKLSLAAFIISAVLLITAISLIAATSPDRKQIELSIPANGIVVFPFRDYTVVAFRTNLFSVNGKEKRIELENGEYMTIER